MNEIEKDERIWEIEEYIKEYEKRDSGEFLQVEILAYKRVKFLLSSLETSQQAREILRKNIEKMQDWGDKIEQENEELKISLEKEKERISEAEFLRNGMQDRCNELFLENEKLKEKVKELERKVENLIATIVEDLSEDRQNLESRLKELMEAAAEFEKSEIIGEPTGIIDAKRKLYKVLEKFSSSLGLE